jgi:ribokinase
MAAKINIVVAGSSNTDMVIRVPKLPGPGETVLGGRFSVSAGGKGANQAVAAARAGGRVAFISKVGDDDLGRRAIEGFQREGIDISRVHRDKKAPTGVAMIYVDATGENCIAVAAGANEHLVPRNILSARALIAKASVLLVQLEIPPDTVEAAVKAASESGTKVILNPAPARFLSDEILRSVSVLTPNETEAAILLGTGKGGDYEKAAGKLRKKGVETVIITLGSKGAFVSGDEFSGLIPAYHVNPVDTTAAGDVFNGALAVGLAENKNIREAVSFASAAAAISVTRPGAQASAPSSEEIIAFIKKHQS